MIFAVEAARRGIRAAAVRLGHFLLALVPAMLLAYAVMALIWPWSVIDPLNPFRAVEYFSHFFEKPWQELFDGIWFPFRICRALTCRRYSRSSCR